MNPFNIGGSEFGNYYTTKRNAILKEKMFIILLKEQMGSLIHVAVLWAKIFFSLDQVLGSHLLKAQVRNIWISVEFVQNCFGVERGFMKLNMFAIIVFMVTCAQKIALKKIHYKNFYFFYLLVFGTIFCGFFFGTHMK